MKGKLKQFFVTGYLNEVFVVEAASKDAAVDIVGRKCIEVDPDPDKTVFKVEDLQTVLFRAFDNVTFLSAVKRKKRAA